MARPAVFLDRDGTLIEDADFLTSADEIRILPNAIPGLKRLHEAGYLLVVVTNQSGVARGYLTKRELETINDHLVDQIATLGGHIDGIFYCPHHPDGQIKKYARQCKCRKPLPGLFIQAREELDIDLDRSFAIGDAWRDVEAALAVGVPSVKLPRPAEGEELPRPDLPLLAEARDIDQAADIILSTSPEEARAKLDKQQEKIRQLHGQLPTMTPPAERFAEPPESEDADDGDEALATAVAEADGDNGGPLFDSSLDQSPLLVEEEIFEKEEKPDEQVETEIEEPDDEAATQESRDQLPETGGGENMIETAAGQPHEARTPPTPATQSTQSAPALECDRCGITIDLADTETGLAATFQGSLLCRECLPAVVRMAATHAAGGSPPPPEGSQRAAVQTGDQAIRELTLELRRLIRRGDSDSFGMPRIMGYIAQIGALILALVAPLRGGDWREIGVWLLAATFVQLIALTMFIISTKRS